MSEHAKSARLSEVAVAQAKKKRRQLVEEMRQRWFVRIFQPTLVTLMLEPTVITTFFYFCARLVRLSEPERPVEWIHATRSEIAEAIRPEKTRKGPKRQAKDPEQAVTKHLTTCIACKLLERHPDDDTRYRIPVTAAQFGQIERLKVQVTFASVRGLFLADMESVWLHRPHAMRVVIIMLRRMADRHGKGHNWYSATEADWMAAATGKAKPDKRDVSTPRKPSGEKAKRTERKKLEPKGMSPRLLRMAIKQLKDADTLGISRDGRKCFYQIPKELASAVSEKAPHSFHPQRQKSLIL